MEPREVLKKAWRVVEDAGLPKEIQPMAFREAVRLISPAPACSAPRAVGVGTTGKKGGGGGKKFAAEASADGSGGIGATESEIYERVVAQTGVAHEKLEQIVHLDGELLKVSLPGIKLGRNNSEKTRSIAQILTIVRGFGLEESETSIEVVRAEANRLKCYDSPNFSAHLSKLVGFVITGSGTNRRIRAKPAGIQAFPALVDRLLGEA